MESIRFLARKQRQNICNCGSFTLLSHLETGEKFGYIGGRHDCKMPSGHERLMTGLNEGLE